MPEAITQSLGNTLGPAGQDYAGKVLYEIKIKINKKAARPVAANIDPALLNISRFTNSEDQISAARELSAQRRDEPGERGDAIKDRQLLGQNIQEALVSDETRFNAASYGQEVGEYLRQEIAEGKFNAFLIVLLLSAIKDFTDLTTGGTITVYIIGPFITSALLVVFFMQKSCFKRWFIRKYLWKYLAWVVVGYMPFLATMPEMVMATILLKLKADKKIRAQEKELEDVENSTAKLQQSI